MNYHMRVYKKKYETTFERRSSGGNQKISKNIYTYTILH